MPFVTADAPVREELSSCVRCGLCLPHCPTYRLTGKEAASPRGRISAMAAVLEGVIAVDAAFDEAVSFCLGCRACEAVCPSLVPYGRLLEGARAEVTAQRPTIGRRARRLLLGRGLGSRSFVRVVTVALSAVQRLGVTTVMRGSVGRGLAGVRRLHPVSKPWLGRSAEPTGPPLGTVTLLSGCVMDSWFGGVHDATAGILLRAGFRVVAPEGQTCCGALAAHDGHVAEARRLAQANVAAFEGAALIVSDAAGCTAHLKGYGHWVEGGDEFEAKVRDATELIAELIAAGRLPRFSPTRGTVAIQDPCHLRHAQRIVAPPREIVAAAGYQPVEIDVDGLCCGAAGVYSLLRPGPSHELGVRKARQVRESGAMIVASANPGCEMQLRSHLPKSVRVAHPVELYWEALLADGEAP